MKKKDVGRSDIWGTENGSMIQLPPGHISVVLTMEINKDFKDP